MESGKKRIITEAEMEKQHEYARSISAMISGGKNACVITYGCQQNEADSERIAGTLADMGYRIVSEAADADLIIVNTCAVRDHAEKKALSITGGYKHLKEKNPALIIGVCGCMPAQSHRIEQLKKSYPYVDMVVGTNAFSQFPKLLNQAAVMGINAGGIQFIIKIDDGFLLCLRKLIFHRSASFALAAFTGVSVLEDKSESLPSTDSRLLISASSARSQSSS